MHSIDLFRVRISLAMIILICITPVSVSAFDCVKLAPLLRDTGNSAQNASSYRRVVMSFLEEETRSYKHFRQRLDEAKVSIPVAVLEQVFPVEFEGKSRDDDRQWEDYRRLRKTYLETADFKQASYQNSFSTLKAEALKTIESCFASSGLHVFDDYEETNSDVVNVYFNYIGEPAVATLNEPLRVTPEGSWKCTTSFVKKGGQIGSNFRNESCERQKDVEATISVVSNRGSKSVNLPTKIHCSYRVEEKFLACTQGQMGKRIQKRQYCTEGKPTYTNWIDAGSQCGPPDTKSTSEVAKAIYRHALKREASSGEIEASRALLSSGITVRQVLKNVIGTEEFKTKFYSNIPPHPNNHLLMPGVWGTGGLGGYTPQAYTAATPLIKTIYEIALARDIDGDGPGMSQRIASRCGFSLGMGLEKPLCYGGFLEELRDTQMNGAEYLQKFGEDIIPYPSGQADKRVRYHPKVSDCIENDSACR